MKEKLKKLFCWKLGTFFFGIGFIVLFIFALYSANFQPTVYLKKILYSEKNGFNWASLTAVAAVGALGVSVFGFWWSYQSTLKHNMFMEKLKVYRAYVQNISDSTKERTIKEDGELAIRHLKTKQELLLFAPESIVDLAVKIEPLDLSDPIKRNYYYDLISEMRFDLLKSNSKVNSRIIDNLLGDKTAE